MQDTKFFLSTVSNAHSPMPESCRTLIKVAVNRPVDTTYVYRINSAHGKEIIGSRVQVDFAGSTQTAIVCDLCSNKDCDTSSSKIKDATLLDAEPVISHDVMQLLRFGSDYYQFPLGQCLQTALPKKLRDGEDCVYEKIPGLKLKEDVDEAMISKLRSKQQREIIYILKNGPVRRKELRERGISSQNENALIKKGLVLDIDLNTPSLPWQEQKKDLIRQSPPTANPSQQHCIDEISQCSKHKVFLLNGITGSGKTEVYLQVIANVLKQKKAVLVLVPEIALTPQTFERFYRRFNVPVSSVHSQLSDRERLDAIIDMKSSRSAVLIGTRTALFTPIPNLGLIVLDEEHDSSFKQSDGFRYHARSLAIMRAKICNCPVVLGSATPSLESFYNVYRGIFHMLRLTERAGGASLPDISLIDLRKQELSPGLKCGIGEELESAIGEETAKGNQVLLFLNRRGYSHHLLCHNCGHVFTCPSCDNPLTVHRVGNLLKCHICEHRETIPQICPHCGQSSLIETGFGTEQTEEFLKLRYPDVGTERIDRDTVTSKAQLETRLSRIRNGQSGILLGTQMIAKGHDFPNVTLVGILDLDSNLFSDDFRALEFSAQLLTQVAGRAGRASKKGRVLIQTHHPDNLLVTKLIDPAVSYEQIAQLLLHMRQNLSLPPFTHQAYLLSNSSDRSRAFDFLEKLLEIGQNELNKYPSLGVSPVLSDKMEKRQNRYHFHILLTSRDRSELSLFIRMMREKARDVRTGADVRFAVEIDPIMMY